MLRPPSSWLVKLALGCFVGFAFGCLVGCHRQAAESSSTDSTDPQTARPDETNQSAKSVEKDEPPLALTAEALLASASDIEKLEVLDPETQAVRAVATAEQLSRVKSSLKNGKLQSSFSATSPPWDAALRLIVSPERSFIAHPVGTHALRINARDPFSVRWSRETGEPLPGVQEILMDERLFNVLTELLGPPGKEYRPAKPIDIHQLRGEPSP